VSAVAVAPEGDLVAAGGRDGIVRLWKPDGAPLREFQTVDAGLPEGAVTAVGITSKYVVAGQAQTQLIVSARGQNTAIAVGVPLERIYAIAALRGGDVVAVGGGQTICSVCLVDVQKREVLRRLTDHIANVSAICPLGENTSFVSGDWQGRLLQWHPKQGSSVIGATGSAVFGIGATRHAGKVVVVLEDQRVDMFVSGERQQMVGPMQKGEHRKIGVIPGSECALVCPYGAGVAILSLKDGTCVTEGRIDTSSRVTGLAVSENGKRAVIGTETGRVCFLSIAVGTKNPVGQ
jgi:WD40 repeat protein